MNELARSVTRMIQGGNDILVRRSGDRVIIDSTVEQQRRRGGGGTAQKSIEVRIVRAIASASDTTDQTELDAFNQFGPHLKCWAIDAQGNFITTQDQSGETVRAYYVVYSNWMHPISDFKDAMGNQIYNALSPSAPVFTAFLGQRGWTLSFGEGERWVPAPSQAAICPSKAPTGACCLPDESCEIMSQDACTNRCGVYLGDMSACPAPGTCPDVPPCNNDEGACCVDGVCTSEIQSDCLAMGGVFHAGVICAGVDCLAGLMPCCLGPSTCLLVSSQMECTGMSGIVSGAANCQDANCDLPVACCNPNGTCNNLPESACTASGGGSLGWGSTCAADGGLCPQPQSTGCCSSTGFTCYVTSVAQCLANGDNPTGTPACSGPTPCVGACCVGTACNLTYDHLCIGTFRGPGTTCSPNPCTGGLSQPPSSPPGLFSRLIRRVTGA